METTMHVCMWLWILFYAWLHVGVVFSMYAAWWGGILECWEKYVSGRYRRCMNIFRNWHFFNPGILLKIHEGFLVWDHFWKSRRIFKVMNIFQIMIFFNLGTFFKFMMFFECMIIFEKKCSRNFYESSRHCYSQIFSKFTFFFENTIFYLKFEIIYNFLAFKHLDCNLIEKCTK